VNARVPRPDSQQPYGRSSANLFAGHASVSYLANLETHVQYKRNPFAAVYDGSRSDQKSGCSPDQPSQRNPEQLCRASIDGEVVARAEPAIADGEQVFEDDVRPERKELTNQGGNVGATTINGKHLAERRIQALRQAFISQLRPFGEAHAALFCEKELRDAWQWPAHVTTGGGANGARMAGDTMAITDVLHQSRQRR